MSAPRAIPKRKQPRQSGGGSSSSSSGSGSGSYYNNDEASSSSSSSSPYSRWNASSTSMRAGPSSLCSSSSTPSAPCSAVSPSGSAARFQDRRPSLLSSSLSKSEYTVVNVGGPDGPPRLITCVKASQGFDWNQDIFLPSYMDYDSSDLEHRPDPMHEIVLTDEEAAAILPQ